jgi:hypothetical protein
MQPYHCKHLMIWPESACEPGSLLQGVDELDYRFDAVGPAALPHG